MGTHDKARAQAQAEIDALHRDLASDLRRLRAAAGNQSLRSLAERSQTSVSSLSRMLSGQRLPSWRTLQALLIACDVDQAEIDRWRARWTELNERARDRAGMSAAQAGQRPDVQQAVAELDADSVLRSVGTTILETLTMLLERVEPPSTAAVGASNPEGR